MYILEVAPKKKKEVCLEDYACMNPSLQCHRTTPSKASTVINFAQPYGHVIQTLTHEVKKIHFLFLIIYVRNIVRATRKVANMENTLLEWSHCHV